VQMFEAARKFAERIIREGGSDPKQRIIFAFRSVTSRRPTSSELASLHHLFSDYQKELKRNKKSAAKLLTVGESSPDKALDANELGLWTLIAHLLLNLSETVTKG